MMIAYSFTGPGFGTGIAPAPGTGPAPGAYLRERRGVALLIVLAILTFMTLLGLALVLQMGIERNVAHNRTDRLRAFNMAQTGLAVVRYKLGEGMMADSGAVLPAWQSDTRAVWEAQTLSDSAFVSFPLAADTVYDEAGNPAGSDRDGDGSPTTIHNRPATSFSGFRGDGFLVRASVSNSATYLGSSVHTGFDMGTYEHLGDVYKLRVMDASGKINLKSWNPYKPSSRRKLIQVLTNLGEAIQYWFGYYRLNPPPGSGAALAALPANLAINPLPVADLPNDGDALSVIEEIVRALPDMTSMEDLARIINEEHRGGVSDLTDYFMLVEPFVTLESWPRAVDPADPDWWDKYNKYKLFYNDLGEADEIDPDGPPNDLDQLRRAYLTGNDLTANWNADVRGLARDPWDYSTGVAPGGGAAVPGQNMGFDGRALRVRRQAYDDRYTNPALIGNNMPTDARPLNPRPRSPVCLNTALPPVLEALIYGLGARVPFIYQQGTTAHELLDGTSANLATGDAVNRMFTDLPGAAGNRGPDPIKSPSIVPTATTQYEYSETIYLDPRVLTDSSSFATTRPPAATGYFGPTFAVKFIELYPWNDTGAAQRSRAREVARRIYERIHIGMGTPAAPQYEPFNTWEEFEIFIDHGFQDAAGGWPDDDAGVVTAAFLLSPADTGSALHLVEYPWRDRDGSPGMDSRAVGAIFDFNPFKNTSWFAAGTNPDMASADVNEARRRWSRWYNRAAKDLLIANFNPNVSFPGVNPDFPMARSVSKFDLVTHVPPSSGSITYQRPVPGGTTEGCFVSGGTFDVTAAGLITRPMEDDLGPSPSYAVRAGTVVARATLRAKVRVWDVMSIGTQHDFYDNRVFVDPNNPLVNVLYLTAGRNNAATPLTTIGWPNAADPRLAGGMPGTSGGQPNTSTIPSVPTSGASWVSGLTTGSVYQGTSPPDVADPNTPLYPPGPISQTPGPGGLTGGGTPGTGAVLGPARWGGWIQLSVWDRKGPGATTVPFSATTWVTGGAAPLINTFQLTHDVNPGVAGIDRFTPVNANIGLVPEIGVNYPRLPESMDSDPGTGPTGDYWFGGTGVMRDFLWPHYPVVTIRDNNPGPYGYPFPTVLRPDGMLNSAYAQRRYVGSSPDRQSGMPLYGLYRVFGENDRFPFFGVRAFTGKMKTSGTPLRPEQVQNDWIVHYQPDSQPPLPDRYGSQTELALGKTDIKSIERQQSMSVAPYSGLCDFWIKLDTPIDGANRDNPVFCGLWAATIPLSPNKIEGVTMLCYIDSRGYLRFSKLYYAQPFKDNTLGGVTGDAWHTFPDGTSWRGWLTDAAYEDEILGEAVPNTVQGFPQDVEMLGWGENPWTPQHNFSARHRRYYSQKWVRTEVFVPLVRHSDTLTGGEATRDQLYTWQPHEWHHVLMAWRWGVSYELDAAGTKGISVLFDPVTGKLFPYDDATGPGFPAEMRSQAALAAGDLVVAADDHLGATPHGNVQIWLDGVRQIDYTGDNHHRRMINAGPNLGYVAAALNYKSGGLADPPGYRATATPPTTEGRAIVRSYGRTNQLLGDPGNLEGPPGTLYVHGFYLPVGQIRSGGPNTNPASEAGDWQGLLKFGLNNTTGQVDKDKRLGPAGGGAMANYIVQARSNATLDDMHFYHWDPLGYPGFMDQDYTSLSRYRNDGDVVGEFEHAFANPYENDVTVGRLLWSQQRPRYNPVEADGLSSERSWGPEVADPDRPYVSMELEGYTLNSGNGTRSAWPAPIWTWNSAAAVAAWQNPAGGVGPPAPRPAGQPRAEPQTYIAGGGDLYINKVLPGRDPATGSRGVAVWRARFHRGTMGSAGPLNVSPALDDVNLVVMPAPEVIEVFYTAE